MSPGVRRLLTWTLLGGAGLAILLGAAPLLLNQERYRVQLAARVSRLLNRDVTVERLRVRLLPAPRAIVQGVTVADRDPSSGPFVAADRLEVRLRLWPLFRGQLQVGQIRIDRPRIRIARGPDGWNLEDLVRLPARAPGLDRQPGNGARPARGDVFVPAVFAGALTVRNGTLRLERTATDGGSSALEIQDLAIDAVTPRSPDPVRIEASGRLAGEDRGTIELTLRLWPEPSDRPPVEADATVRRVDLSRLFGTFGRSGGLVSPPRGHLDLRARARGSWPFLDLEGEAVLWPARPRANGSPATAPAEGWRLRATGRWDGTTVDLGTVALHWGDQGLTGRVRVSTLTAPRLHADLSAADLRLDDLVAMVASFGAGEQAGAAPGAAGKQTAARGREHPRAAAPPDLRFEGRLRTGALRWGRLVVAPAEAAIRYADGVLAIRGVRGGLYGGSLLADAVLDRRGREPRTRITARLEGVQTEPLVMAVQAQRWRLRGIMTLHATLEWLGPLGPDILAHASGRSDLLVTGGQLIEYPPLDRIVETLGPLLRGVGFASDLNAFDRLSGRWTLAHGFLRTDDLLLQREGARLMAVGSLDVKRQHLDFDVTARVARVTLEAKVGGTTSEPTVTPNVGRVERRIRTEVGKILKDKRGEAVGKALREFFPR